MTRASRRTGSTTLLLLLALSAASFTEAQLSNLPTLGVSSTVAPTSTSASATSASSSAAPSTTATTAQASTPASFAISSTTSVFHLTGLPTIEGAGIPTLVIPYTADAPFMKKSSVPQGTVFIGVGAVLGFLGACVVLWRGIIAWSINRSVKKAALASIGRSGEVKTHWGGSTHVPSAKAAFYKDTAGAGSSMSLDALTSSGKPLKSYKDEPNLRSPSALFFSPTAQATSGGQALHNQRSSTYLPAGYYASPSAQPAGGAGATTIGGSLVPYARHSTIGTPSPPASPRPQTAASRSSYRAASRDRTRASYNDGLRATSRDGYGSARNSYFGGGAVDRHSGLYAQPSSSSLLVGVGQNDGFGGSRAPSAYLEDLFDNHGHGPRERF